MAENVVEAIHELPLLRFHILIQQRPISFLDSMLPSAEFIHSYLVFSVLSIGNSKFRNSV
jgi:hypothetical protein